MKPISNIVSLWFGIIMVLVLLAGSVAILFTDFMSDRLQGQRRIFFVVLLLAYCVYRSYRIYQVIKENRNEE